MLDVDGLRLEAENPHNYNICVGYSYVFDPDEMKSGQCSYRLSFLSKQGECICEQNH